MVLSRLRPNIRIYFFCFFMEYRLVISTWRRGRPGRFRVARAVELGLVIPGPEFLERWRFGLFQHADDIRAVSVGYRGGHTVGGKCTK